MQQVNHQLCVAMHTTQHPSGTDDLRLWYTVSLRRARTQINLSSSSWDIFFWCQFLK